MSDRHSLWVKCHSVQESLKTSVAAPGTAPPRGELVRRGPGWERSQLPELNLDLDSVYNKSIKATASVQRLPHGGNIWGEGFSVGSMVTSKILVETTYNVIIVSLLPPQHHSLRCVYTISSEFISANALFKSFSHNIVRFLSLKLLLQSSPVSFGPSVCWSHSK